jgi:hypothetical protein
VYLISTGSTHIEQDGIVAPATITSSIRRVATDSADDTPKDNSQALVADAIVHASATVVGSMGVSVTFTLYDSTKAVAHASSAPASSAGMHNVSLSVAGASLWSVGHPFLYTLVASVVSSAKPTTILDSVNTSVGIRSLKYTGDGGFFMNSEHVKVRGFCDHESWGGVGMAVPDRIALFRAQASRSVGGNGRRSSHNPAHPVILDIYDRLGMVVMDENRLYRNDPVEIAAMAKMVKRDRNHPSVTIWSFCNEGGCTGAPNGTGGLFRDAAYEYDGTRPTLGNHNGGDLNNYMDVQGFSHKSAGTFEAYHARDPSKPLMASECCSCMTMRGEDRTIKPQPDLNATSTSVHLGVERPPSPGGPGILAEWNAPCLISQSNGSNGLSYMVGTEVWTLFDYYGESHGWPHVISMYGQFDVPPSRHM